GSINIEEFSKELGIPVVPISAMHNQGIDELYHTAIDVAKKNILPKKVDFCGGAVHRAIHGVAHLIEDHAASAGIATRFAATKLIEGDKIVEDTLNLSKNEKETLEHCIAELETDLKTDKEAALADMRYDYIEAVIKDTIIKPPESKEEIRSTKIDRLLTHRYLGIPVFLGIMLTIFFLTFAVIGKYLSDLLMLGVDSLSNLIEKGMTAVEMNPVVIDLVIKGAFAGVGTVLSFLPYIVVLFFFLSLMEDSGYMARISFIMDKPLRRLGLSGKSFVPMLVGFGCSVPAIMATRTLASDRDRKMTILLIPFMSCSAKLPVYALLSAAFFPRHATLVMMSLYLTGIILGILLGMILKRTAFKGNSIPFILELPNYRMPSIKSVMLLVWDRAKDFMQRAFTIIFFATLIIWFLQSFDFRLNVTDTASESILATIASGISIIFEPLGFGNWQSTTALISGFTAKEAVIGSLAVVTGSNVEGLSGALTSIFTPLSVISFLVFTLLYTPCVA
ncbi:MAG: ferrous iron transport protein B, partial [Anaerovoracaceae bacterium]